MYRIIYLSIYLSNITKSVFLYVCMYARVLSIQGVLTLFDFDVVGLKMTDNLRIGTTLLLYFDLSWVTCVNYFSKLFSHRTKSESAKLVLPIESVFP